MVLFASRIPGEWRAFRPSQVATQAAPAGTCTHRKGSPDDPPWFTKLTGPDSESQAPVYKQHCLSFPYHVLMLPPVPGQAHGSLPLQDTSHPLEFGLVASETLILAQAASAVPVLAWETEISSGRPTM